MSDSELVFVKLGGSLITDKRTPRTVARPALERIARELATALDEGPQTGGPPLGVILGHGSGSFGHVAAREHDLGERVVSAREAAGVAATQAAARVLHGIVVGALLEAGLRPYSIAPASCFLAAGGSPIALDLEPLSRALDLGLLPVVFGDVVMDRDLGASILSTEKVFHGIASRLAGAGPAGLRISRAIWLGATDGIYDASGETVRRLDRAGVAELSSALGGSSGTDVTGGMRHRAESALALAELGIRSVIANGRRPGLLRDALVGYQVQGTLVEPAIP